MCVVFLARSPVPAFTNLCACARVCFAELNVRIVNFSFPSNECANQNSCDFQIIRTTEQEEKTDEKFIHLEIPINQTKYLVNNHNFVLYWATVIQMHSFNSTHSFRASLLM